MKRNHKLLIEIDFFKLYDIKKWVKYLGIPLIAFLCLNPTDFDLSLFVIILFQLILLFAWSFAINDYFDAIIRREKNYINKLLKLYHPRKILILCILPLIFLFLSFLIHSKNSVFLLLYIFLYDLLYEFPPFRLKRNFLYSIIVCSISTGMFPFLYTYLSFSSTFSLKALVFLFIFFFYTGFHEILHQMAHFKKERVLPKSIGLKGAIKIAQFFLLMPAVISTITLLLEFSQSSVFLITPIFSLLRIYKLSKMPLKPEKIEKMRDKFYFIYEGIIYVSFLVFSHLFLKFFYIFSGNTSIM
jgi:4-hydroxybenzoate polyprenyltransferase